MAEKWKPTSPIILSHWIDAIFNEAFDELTDWEMTFVDDIAYSLKLGATLTQSQEEKLEQIYAEKTK
jgi:hypothetical protein